MASERDDTVFPEEDLDEEDDSQEDDDDAIPEDDEDLISTSSLPLPLADPASVVTVAVPGTSVFNGNPPPSLSPALPASDPKLHSLTAPEERKPPPQPLDEARRLFQRLWTDEDEIELLQGFLDYSAQRGSSHHHDTALFYDQIKSKLQLDCNKNQLVEKLRRLKKKYRNVVAKIDSGKDFSFKSPHDQATFELSRKIWSNTGRVGVEDNALDDDDESNPTPNLNLIYGEVKNEDIVGHGAEKKTTPRSRKRSRSRAGLGNEERPVMNDGLAAINGNNSNTHTTGLIEDTVKSCLSPLFKELLSNAVGMGSPCTSRGFGAMAFNPMPLTFGGLTPVNFGVGEAMDEKWRKQQILELEVYSKRLELIQDQIKTTLEELRSTGG